jgi:hypothetical protein
MAFINRGIIIEGDKKVGDLIVKDDNPNTNIKALSALSLALQWITTEEADIVYIYLSDNECWMKMDDEKKKIIFSCNNIFTEQLNTINDIINCYIERIVIKE